MHGSNCTNELTHNILTRPPFGHCHVSHLTQSMRHMVRGGIGRQ